MSIKINLDFETKIDVEFLTEGVAVKIVRLYGTIQLKTIEGWSPEETAIVDTGNPISVIPRSIWEDINYKILIHPKTKIYGIGTSDAQALTGSLAEVTMIFKDRNSVSLPIKTKVHLLDDDSVPLIIGYEDILTKSKLVSDYKNSIAYLDFK